MITITCDKCDKPFETDDDAAGQKVECPYCGDINRAPSSATTAPSAATASSIAATSPAKSVAPIGKPRAKDTHNIAAAAANQPETTIAIVRQAMFRAHPFWYSLMVLLGLGGLALAIAARTTASLADKPWLMYVGLGVLIACVLWWFIWWIAPHRWIKLTITNKRTIRQEGIVVRKTSEVLHSHIRNVKIEQSFLERLLNVGSISIDTAGGENDQMVEIEMQHVPTPYRVKETIDRHRGM